MNSPTETGIPISKQGSPKNNYKKLIPVLKWGCVSDDSPNRNGYPHSRMGIIESPFRNGDPYSRTGTCVKRIPKPKRGSPFWKRTQYHNGDGSSDMGTRSVTNPYQFGDVSNLGHGVPVPKLEWYSNGGHNSGTGIPISEWVGFGQKINLGSDVFGMGIVQNWGPTHIP